MSQITIRVLPFSGKESKWRMWSRKFIATAMARGYKEVLEPRDPTIAAQETDNDKAYNDLMLSINDEVTFGIVDEALSEAHPTGDARLAWSELKRKFEPKTGFSEVKLKREFNSSQLAEGEDPDAYVNGLLHKKRQLEVMGTKLSERDVMIHILGSLPSAYDTMVDMAEKDLISGTLTIEILRELLRTKYEKLKGGNEDVSLFTKQFKKSCTICGKIGHKSVDCFTLPQNSKKKEEYMKNMREKNRKNQKNQANQNNGQQKRDLSKIRCYACNKMGHYKINCPEKKNESANNAQQNEDTDEEYAMVCCYSAKINENSAWIADTGASTHMCKNLHELSNLRSVNQTVQVGNGQRIKCTQAGTWKGVYKVNTSEEFNIKLENVLYVPGLMQNLLSLTQVVEKGWELQGTKGNMRVQKNKRVLNFGKNKCGSGFVYSLDLTSAKNIAYAAISKEDETRRIHKLFCHANMPQAKLAAQKIGINVDNVNNTIDCQECKIAKASQKAIVKQDETRSSTPGE